MCVGVHVCVCVRACAWVCVCACVLKSSEIEGERNRGRKSEKFLKRRYENLRFFREPSSPRALKKELDYFLG